MRRPRIRARSGFTLVELLVVMAILLVLAGLLFPAIFSARAKARSVRCQSQLRQIGFAIMEYADTNKGLYPPFRWNDGGQMEPRNPPPMSIDLGAVNVAFTKPRWNVVIAPFIEGSIDVDILDPDGDGIANYDDDHTPYANEVFICPDSSERTTSRNGSYGFNYQFIGHARQFRDTIPRPYGKPWINYPVSSGSIQANSRTILVADSFGTASSIAEALRSPWSGETNNCTARGNHSYSLDPPVPYFTDGTRIRMGLISSGSCEKLTGGFSGAEGRHSGRANIVFADGHVESMTPEEMGYIVRADGSYSYNNLEELYTDKNGNGIPDRKDEWVATNRLFTGTGIHRLLPLQWRDTGSGANRF